MPPLRCKTPQKCLILTFLPTDKTSHAAVSTNMQDILILKWQWFHVGIMQDHYSHSLKHSVNENGYELLETGIHGESLVKVMNIERLFSTFFFFFWEENAQKVNYMGAKLFPWVILLINSVCKSYDLPTRINIRYFYLTMLKKKVRKQSRL